MQKRNVLFLSEASFLNTGFSGQSRYIINYLNNTGKYNITELGSYAPTNDPRSDSVPWKFYGSVPDGSDPYENHKYQSYEGQFGYAVFEKVLLENNIDTVCLPPGELVFTEKGYQPIESINIGDIVLSDKGVFQKVNKTYKRQHKGKLIKIYANGMPDPLIVTEDHPVLIHKFVKSSRWAGLSNFMDKYEYKIPIFVPAKEVKTGDLVMIPCGHNLEEKNNKKISITDYLSNYSENKNKIYPEGYIKSGNGIKKNLRLSTDFFTLIGYIISDGYISDNGISITFQGNELEFVYDAIRITRNLFGIEGKFSKESRGKYAYVINWNSVILSRFLKKFLNNDKSIPKEVYYSKKYMIGLIRGLYRGDGCYKKNTVSLGTINKKLALDVRQIGAFLGIPLNLSYNKSNKCYEVNGYASSAEELHKIVEKYDYEKFKRNIKNSSNRRIQKIGNFIVSSVRQIKKQEYDGQVFNISVANDNTYVSNFVVHNCDIRDMWFIDWELKSPFRKYFNLIWMPTIDSEPQQRIWIDELKRIDGLITLSRYGKEVLEREAGKQLKIFDIGSPGADHNLFVPLNKEECRKNLGLPLNSNILMTVMRNQKRKLFPDLIEIFANLLEKFRKEGKNNLAQNTYLYLHTSYPDVGFDIPKFIYQNGVSNKVYLTYNCKACSNVWADFWQGEICFCPRCKQDAGHLPNTNFGVSQEKQVQIINCADLYIQYSIAEGFGMPLCEAKMCGIPAMAVDYTAMSEQVEIPGCEKIKVKKYYYEPVIETQQIRCFPDNEDALNKLYNWFIQPRFEWTKHSKEIRNHAVENNSFERAAKVFEKMIDSLPYKDPQNTWFSQKSNYLSNRINIPEEIMKGRSHRDFLNYLIDFVINQPELKDTEWTGQLIKSLNIGYLTLDKTGKTQFNRNECVKMFGGMLSEYNYWEKKRLEKLGINDGYLEWINA